MKYRIITIGIIAFTLSGCDTYEQRVERQKRIEEKRVENLENFGFTNIMFSDVRSYFAEKDGHIYKVDFGLGISETPLEMKAVIDGRVTTLK